MRVLVADDHASVREAVKAVLGFEDDIEVVGEAEDGPGALRLAHELQPDAIVLDNWMPGLLRDIGKIALPAAVLTKRDPLDPSEREQVRTHVTLGADILAGSESLRDLAWLVRHHHERYDGSGYPNGLRGDDIPLGAQIVGVLDAYNAIVSPRCYKPAFPPRFALEQLALGAGRDFAMPLVAP